MIMRKYIVDKMRIKCGNGAARCWVTAKTSNWNDFHIKNTDKLWANRARNAASTEAIKVTKQKEAMKAKIRELNVKIDVTRKLNDLLKYTMNIFVFF